MLTIHRIGTDYHHDRHFRIDRPHGTGDHLLLLFHTPIMIQQDDVFLTHPKGTLILYTPTFAQHYHHDVDGFCNDWIHFDGAQCASLIRTLPRNQPFTVLDWQRAAQSFHQIEEEMLRQEAEWPQMVHHMLSAFLLQLGRSLHRQPVPAMQQNVIYHDDTLRRVRTLVLQQLHKPWTLPLMAQEAGLSVSRFSHLYTQLFGQGPKADLNAHRLSTAAHLLRTTPMTVSHIAARVGYESVYHFSKQFKKVYNVSPRQHRCPATVRRKPTRIE